MKKNFLLLFLDCGCYKQLKCGIKTWTTFTCVCTLVCFEVWALGVHLPAPVEVTPVHPPPPIRGCLPAGQPWPLHTSDCPCFPRRVQHSVYSAPHLGYRAVFFHLGWGRWCADDGWPQLVSTFTQDVSQRAGSEVKGRGEFFWAVRGLAAGVGVKAPSVHMLGVLIVFFLFYMWELWVGVTGLVPASKHQLAPQILLVVKLEVCGWDVGLTLEVPFQLKARLRWRRIDEIIAFLSSLITLQFLFFKTSTNTITLLHLMLTIKLFPGLHCQHADCLFDCTLNSMVIHLLLEVTACQALFSLGNRVLVFFLAWS